MDKNRAINYTISALGSSFQPQFPSEEYEFGSLETPGLGAWNKLLRSARVAFFPEIEASKVGHPCPSRPCRRKNAGSAPGLKATSVAVPWRPLLSPLTTREEPAEGPHASRTCPLRTAMSVGSGGWEGQARPGHDHDWVVARVRPAVRRMLRGEWLVSAVTVKKLTQKRSNLQTAEYTRSILVHRTSTYILRNMLVFLFFMRKNRKCIAFWREGAWYQLPGMQFLWNYISVFFFFYFLRALLVDA